MELFTIKNQLLREAFFGNATCIKNCPGYLEQDKFQLGRGFIEFCTMRTFNIYRLPGFEPFYISNSQYQSKMKESYGNLNNSDITNACNELLELYNFVQNQLKNSPFNIGGNISLIRALNDYEICEVEPQLFENMKKIRIPVNIINSYSYDEEKYCYNSNISILRNVPIENILFVDKYIQKPDGFCNRSAKAYEYEVLVIEDNIFGEIFLPRKFFNIKDGYTLKKGKNSLHFYCKNTDESVIKIADKTQLPCCKNWFTEKIIEYNQKQILKNNDKKH